MAFTDYLDLRTAVIEEVGDASIADVFDRLTKLAESRFNRELRTRHQITSTTITIVSGVADLPADFKEVIGVYDADGREYPAQSLQTERLPSQTAFYSIGATKINAPAAAVTLEYYATLSTLTTSMTTSNWLLANYPEAYLYGVGYEAAKFKKDVDTAQAMRMFLSEAIDDIRADDERSRYARARVRVKGVTP